MRRRAAPARRTSPPGRGTAPGGARPAPSIEPRASRRDRRRGRGRGRDDAAAEAPRLDAARSRHRTRTARPPPDASTRCTETVRAEAARRRSGGALHLVFWRIRRARAAAPAGPGASESRKLASRQPKLLAEGPHLGVEGVDRVGLRRSGRRSRPCRRRRAARSPRARRRAATTGGHRQLVDQGLQRVGDAEPGRRIEVAAGRGDVHRLARPSELPRRDRTPSGWSCRAPSRSRAARAGPPARTRRSSSSWRARSSSRGRRGRCSGSPPPGRRASRRG